MTEYTITVEQVAREGHEFVRRMLEDWPYQPPEVIGPERTVIREWLERSREVLERERRREMVEVPGHPNPFRGADERPAWETVEAFERDVAKVLCGCITRKPSSRMPLRPRAGRSYDDYMDKGLPF